MKQLNPSSRKRKMILLVAFFAIIKKMFSFWEILAVCTMILHQILLTHLYLYHLDIKSTLRLNFCQILTAHLLSKGNVTEMVDVIIILFYFIYLIFLCRANIGHDSLWGVCMCMFNLVFPLGLSYHRKPYLTFYSESQFWFTFHFIFVHEPVAYQCTIVLTYCQF